MTRVNTENLSRNEVNQKVQTELNSPAWAPGPHHIQHPSKNNSYYQVNTTEVKTSTLPVDAPEWAHDLLNVSKDLQARIRKLEQDLIEREIYGCVADTFGTVTKRFNFDTDDLDCLSNYYRGTKQVDKKDIKQKIDNLKEEIKGNSFPLSAKQLVNVNSLRLSRNDQFHVIPIFGDLQHKLDKIEEVIRSVDQLKTESPLFEYKETIKAYLLIALGTFSELNRKSEDTEPIDLSLLDE